MQREERPRRLAVLETSFWTAAYRAEVAANCLDFFHPIVPGAVQAELLATQPDAPQREYPYATLFRHLRHQTRDPPADAPAPLPLFGQAEAAAISLALKLEVELLINETRAGRYAAELGIQVVTVPALIVLLYAEEIIGSRAAHRKLELIASITTPAILESARLTLAR